MPVVLELTLGLTGDADTESVGGAVPEIVADNDGVPVVLELPLPALKLCVAL